MTELCIYVSNKCFILECSIYQAIMETMFDNNNYNFIIRIHWRLE